MSETKQRARHDHFPAAITAAAHEQKQQYSQGAERPLGGYAAISSVYLTLVGLLVAVGRRLGVRPPAAVCWSDVALMTMATAKISRVIAKDPVTLRAPFTRFKGRSGEAELAEEVRGTGAQHAVGELITCPFCVGQWVATGFAAGATFAPAATRSVALAGTLIAGADVAQYGFAGLQRLWQRTEKQE